MTTQRDRLIALLDDVVADDCPAQYRNPHRWADALMSRGVRVVDERVLAEATVNRCHESLAWDCQPCRRAIDELLAELTGQPIDEDEPVEPVVMSPDQDARAGMMALKR